MNGMKRTAAVLAGGWLWGAVMAAVVMCAACRPENTGADMGERKERPTREMEEYYNWEVREAADIAPGVRYTKYAFTLFRQYIHVVDIDLTNPKIAVETSMANDIVPNPNGNSNHNNGPNGRETLRQNIERKMREGKEILAGINTGFFDSHFGIPRGVHVENREIVYMNNPEVRERLVNHLWGVGVLSDGSLCFDRRDISGSIRMGGTRYEYYSINDTILAHSTSKSPYNVNIYTHRFPEWGAAGVPNRISRSAFYAVCRSEGALEVNTGTQRGVVTRIVDCRKGEAAPFVSAPGEWVVQFAGAMAPTAASVVKPGMEIEFECNLLLGGEAMPVEVYNAGMYYYLRNGVYEEPTPKESADKVYQTMNIGRSADGKRMCLFAVDGINGSRGLDFYEAARVAMKLGLTDVVRFDGGGSTSMWINNGRGGRTVNNISDSNGERSCLNYLHIVKRQ